MKTNDFDFGWAIRFVRFAVKFLEMHPVIWQCAVRQAAQAGIVVAFGSWPWRKNTFTAVVKSIPKVN